MASDRRTGRTQRLNKIGGVVAAAVLAGGITVYAVTADGYESAKAELHDAGVWVTSPTSIGRYNTDVFLVDTKSAKINSVDDLQQVDGTVVYTTGTTLFAYDVAKNRPIIAEGTAFPASARVSLGGPNGAVLDTASGKFWFTSVGAAASVKLGGADESAGSVVLDAAEQVVVGTDGRAHVLASTGTGWTFDAPSPATAVGSVDGADADTADTAAGTTAPLAATPGTEVPPPADEDWRLAAPVGDAQLSAAGRVAVVLDRSTGQLLLEDGAVIAMPEWLGDKGALQLSAPSADGNFVVVAGTGGLALVPLRGGEIVPLDEQGGADPIEPAWVNGCAYGAWAGRWAKVCPDQPERDDSKVLSVRPEAFRQNRGRVVLNNEDGSGVYFDDDVTREFDNEWKDALQPPPETPPEPPVPEENENNECDVEPGATNVAPRAVDDAFTVRAGQVALLDVISGVGSNGTPDSDDDCDVVAIAKVEPADGITIIRNGRALQFASPPDAGTVTFTYTLSDGSETAEADVTVTVLDADSTENTPPTANADTASVAVGKTVVIDVLANDVDEESDPMFVTSVTTEKEADQFSVSWQPNGRVSFTAGAAPGDVVIRYTVSDGIAGADGALAGSEGLLTVSVLAGANQPPNALDDVTQGITGRPVVADVLANDSDPEGDGLRVAGVFSNDAADVQAQGISISSDGSLELTATVPGTYSFIYRVSDGKLEDFARVRFDVRESSTSNPPVPVRDDVVLPAGGSVYVEPLSNDIDADGDLLAIVKVAPTVGDESALSVEVIDQRLVRVTTGSSAQQGDRYTFTYEVSDGVSSAIGTVNVSVVAPQINKPPMAADDVGQVHQGGAVSLPVLLNDFDPNGDQLSLLEVKLLEGNPGEVFIVGDELRYVAARDGVVPTNVTGTYTVTDGVAKVSARFTVSVIPSSENHPPTPPPIEVRVFAGTGDPLRDAVTIELPTAGLDIDGDAVRIVGIRELPKLGVATTDGAQLTFVPSGPQAGQYVTGQDSFTYEVTDGVDSAFGVVRLVVTLRPANSAPIAVDDEVSVRPGSSASLPLLANDIDNDGDPIGLLDLGRASGGTASPDVGRSSVTFEAPAEPGEYRFTYRISDGKAISLPAMVAVKVVEDAPNLAPLAEDDVATPVATGQPFEIDVLKNDRDPEATSLTLVQTETMTAAGVRVEGTTGGQRIVGTMGDAAITFAYAVEDADGARAQAVVRVPLLPADPLPTFVVGTVPLLRTDPARVEIDVAKFFSTPDAGGQPVTVYHGTKPAIVYGGAGLAPGSSMKWTSDTSTTFTLDRNMEYSGEMVVSYVITDGTNIVTALLRLQVEPQTNNPPVAVLDAIEVEAGAPVRQIDLKGAGLVTDPDPGDIVDVTFADAATDESALRLSVTPEGGLSLEVADATAVQDAEVLAATVTLVADDGNVGGAVPLTLNVKVVASRATLPIAVDDYFADIQPGQGAQSLDVRGNDVLGELKGQDTVVVEVTAADFGTVSMGGDPTNGVYPTTVEYEPPADFYGEAHFSYTISDQPGSSTRRSTAFVTVAVRNKPLPPAAPTVGERLSKTAIVSVVPPNDRGAPIDLYQVRISPNGPPIDCPALPCTVEDLKDGDAYRFEMRARNSVDWSDWSPPSAEYTPDQLPSIPPTPTLDWGDRSLMVTWGAIAVSGSPVEYVTVMLSPGNTQVRVDDLNGDGGSTKIPVENGVPYTATLVAHNKLGDGRPSGAPPAVTPVGPPSATGVPSLARGDGFVDVSLPTSPADANGDDAGNLQYTVELIDTASPGSAAASGSATIGTSVRLAAINGRTYTARYTVANAYTAKFAQPAVQSGTTPTPVKACGAPRAGLAPTVAAQGVGDNRVLLNIAPPDAAGCDLSVIRVVPTVGAPQNVAPTAGSYWISVANGTPVRFSIVGVNEVSDGASSPLTASAVTPYGRPNAPAVSGFIVARETMQWSVSFGQAANGPGPVSQTAGASNGAQEGGAGTHSTTVTVCNAGTGGVPGQGCTSTPASIFVPAARVWTTKGPVYNTATGSCAAGRCSFMVLHVEGFSPNRTLSVTCFPGDPLQLSGGTIATDGNGNGSRQLICVAANGANGTVRVSGDGPAVDGSGVGYW